METDLRTRSSAGCHRACALALTCRARRAWRTAARRRRSSKKETHAELRWALVIDWAVPRFFRCGSLRLTRVESVVVFVPVLHFPQKSPDESSGGIFWGP